MTPGLGLSKGLVIRNFTIPIFSNLETTICTEAFNGMGVTEKIGKD
jgi:hypothetical protein